MKKIIDNIHEMRQFLLLWLTQSVSALGSAMTSYALVIWSYSQEGSALITALLMVCSYAPYVICSVFAGALSDRWDKKKTMLCCDAVAAACTLVILLLIRTDNLRIWHLYIINAVSGLMNTVQQPASEVAVTAILPRRHFQRVGGLRYFSNSLNSILTPIIATAILGFGGIDLIITIDIVSFTAAFVSLLLFIRIPESAAGEVKEKGSLVKSAGEGISYLRNNPGIFHLILFLAAINLVASMYNAAFPAMMLSKQDAGETAMGVVNATVGITTLIGSIIASLVKKPKSRVNTIWWCLMVSMGTENLLIALGKTIPVWCIGAFLGWITIPLMSANLEAILRLSIPTEIQGRVFAARNTFQFFTIPLGYLLGGIFVDYVFEPIMADNQLKFLALCFGEGKGSGAAMFFAVLWLMGISVCLLFRKDKHIWRLENSVTE